MVLVLRGSRGLLVLADLAECSFGQFSKAVALAHVAGTEGDGERARKERAVVLADLKCPSFRRSPRVLVLADRGAGAGSSSSFEGGATSGACFGGFQGLLVLADLVECSFGRFCRGSRYGASCGDRGGKG